MSFRVDHTPGPWEIDPADDELIMSTCGTAVAWVCGEDDFPCADMTPAEVEVLRREIAANKHLIAAAPDLFAALLAVAQALTGAHFGAEYVAEPDWNPDAHCDAVTLTIAEARAIYAALAAARGESPGS